MKIEMIGIKKFFGKNEVLKDVSVCLKGGTVHALMGENGAGKSTLMNILIGIHKRDGGKVLIDGEERYFINGKEAEEFGISFIHQEMNNWEEMTVLDNMFLNNEMRNTFGLIDVKKMRKVASSYLNELGLTIDLNQKIGDLSVGQQQIIEIAKSLMTDCKFLIMDEPTAALSGKEIELLFKIIRKLKQKGVGIVYISHRMEEIFELCDEITVMRDGVSIDTVKIVDTDMNDVVKKMVGREITDYYPERNSVIGDVVFEVMNMTSSKGMYEDINFQVRSGEVVGFSGLMGAGRTEIMRGIFGMESNASIEILLENNKLNVSSPSEAIQKGIAFLTEDRKTEGLILDFTIKDNISLPSIDGFTKNSLIDKKTENEFVDLLMKRLQVKAMNRDSVVGDLSGGNQQKVVLAKWIGVGPKVLILDEPTRGVDVGAKREIYQLINDLAKNGVSIIVVSSDLPEVLGISDRIIIIHEGKIAGQLSKADANQEKIMTLATGGQLNG